MISASAVGRFVVGHKRVIAQGRITWDSRAGVVARPIRSGINRRRLRRAAERLTETQHTRLVAALDTAEPNGDILAAWIATELLHEVLACTTARGMCYDIAAASHRFYTFRATTADPALDTRASMRPLRKRNGRPALASAAKTSNPYVDQGHPRKRQRIRTSGGFRRSDARNSPRYAGGSG